MAPYQGESLRASWAGGASAQTARPSAARAPRRGQRGGGCRRQNLFESAIAPPLECEGQQPRLATSGLIYVDTNETGVDFLTEQRTEVDRAAVSDPAQRTTVRSLRQMPAQVACVNFPQPRVCVHDESRRLSSSGISGAPEAIESEWFDARQCSAEHPGMLDAMHRALASK